METVYQWSVRWLDAGRDAAAGPKDVAAALNAHLERMQALETTAKAMVSAGAASRGTQVAASYFRAEAEAWAGKSKKPAPHKKKP